MMDPNFSSINLDPMIFLGKWIGLEFTKPFCQKRWNFE